VVASACSVPPDPKDVQSTLLMPLPISSARWMAACDLSTRKKRYLKATGYGQNALVDAGFLVALLSRRDTHHQWAVAQAPGHAPPWRTCEAVLSEASTFWRARRA